MVVYLCTLSAFPVTMMKAKSSEQEQEKQPPEAGKFVSMAHGCIQWNYRQQFIEVAVVEAVATFSNIYGKMYVINLPDTVAKMIKLMVLHVLC